MKVYCSDKIIKQVHIDNKESVFNIIFTIANKVEKNLVKNVLSEYGDKTMQGAKNIRKFKTDKSNRIIWTYGKYLVGTRNEEADDIFLLAYSNHDSQGRKAANISKDINKRNFYLIDTKKKYANIEIKKLNVRLTNMQTNCLRRGLPLLISGGAGNGKTIVSLNKLIELKSNYFDKNVAYFTFTVDLKNNAKEEYEKISKDNSANLFFAINEYFINLLKFDDSKFIQYSRFKKWFKQSINTKSDIEAIDVWVDIRGIIKGYMGRNWNINHPFEIYLIKQFTRKYLLKSKFIHYADKTNKQILRCKNSTKESFDQIKHTISLDENIETKIKEQMINDIDKTYNYITSFHNFKLVYINDYINLEDDSSKYSKEEKQEIYNIAQKYQTWLEFNNYFDDNDLALAIIKKIDTKKIKKFDYIVVDEIQDLSEIQIKAIISLLKEKNNIVFCGDVHQIIQPTIFATSRIRKLYNNNIIIEYLTVNHRSQGKIVEFSNKLAKLRRNIIGSRKKQSETREEAIWEDVAPFNLIKTEKNVNEAIKYITQLPNAAIIVANEKEQKKLENYLDKGNKAANIYTINEIKGLEWEYIFCYNLIGENVKYFRDIFSKNVKHIGKYRYYFNILYVACTRAKDKLCFCEDEKLYGIKKLISLFNNTTTVKEFDPLQLNMFKSDNKEKEWGINALMLEKQAIYDRASLYYEQSGLLHDAKRCEALYDIKNGERDKGIKKLFNIGEYELTYKYSKKDNKLYKFLSYINFNNFIVKDIEKEYGSKFIFDIYLNNNLEIKEKTIIENKYIAKKINNVENIFVKGNNFKGA